jgi:MFS transporter, DHA1 family, multidrug resistance protein
VRKSLSEFPAYLLTTSTSWRWSFYEVLWMAGPVFILMFITLPETSSSNILLRRARRLRAISGNAQLKAQSEIDQGNMKIGPVIWNSIVTPLEISIKDPAVLFTNIYTALQYGIYYSFFEVFPLVYPVMYGFSLGQTSIVFVCISVACVLGVIIYCSYVYFYLEPDIIKNGLRAQEHRLVPAIFASFGIPIGLFIFGWTSNPDIHWIASVIGITIFGMSGFVLFQCIFMYLPLSYPQYAASLFATNDTWRSALAAGAIIFARPLFINLGVGRGISILAGLAVGGVIGMVVLYYYGARLRARSKFAVT